MGVYSYMDANRSVITDGIRMIPVDATNVDYQRLASECAQIADYVAPALVPDTITRQQCAIGMLTMGLITDAEAVAMAQTGTMPAMVAAMVASLPAAQQVRARIDFARDTYRRDNPLLNTLMLSVPGKSPADVDQFFRDYAYA